ncbi:rhodanese-like domain-containing protein [Candidatus Haliotispira prima]|uniref:Rhodanese-like domain-containing protein n=1 Tax=Candidatus Haliotispira prima TaxID=3034016 RepID=A0ABY8MFM0_9SPIO|nr:rhodanese-like domain-containing protein [Candidatus Haliotispira prima]
MKNDKTVPARLVCRVRRMKSASFHVSAVLSAGLVFCRRVCSPIPSVLLLGFTTFLVILFSAVSVPELLAQEVEEEAQERTLSKLPPRGASGIMTEPEEEEFEELEPEIFVPNTFSGNWEPPFPSGDAFFRLSAGDFRAVLQKNRTVVNLIDVREDYEFAAGHISGATNVPLSKLSVSLAKKYSQRPVLLYCRSGVRSLRAYRDYFSRSGAAVIYHLQSGLVDWQRMGGTVE